MRRRGRPPVEQLVAGDAAAPVVHVRHGPHPLGSVAAGPGEVRALRYRVAWCHVVRARDWHRSSPGYAWLRAPCFSQSARALTPDRLTPDRNLNRHSEISHGSWLEPARYLTWPGSRPSSFRGVRPVLLDRRSECGELDRLVADLRTGQSRALVLWGDVGIGKTALLDHALEHAAGCRVIRASGVEAERDGVRRVASSVRTDAR